MNIYFGENLKKLRQDRNLTQERLADFLGVSFQTISKWERGDNYPDITTLPEIASFFNVTVDNLLGINKVENESEIKEFIEKYDNLFDNDKRIEMIKKMYAKYPGNFNIQLRYLGYLIFIYNSKDYQEHLDEIISIYNNIQDNCTIDSIRICAKRYILVYYADLAINNKDRSLFEKSEKILNEMPHMRDGQEFIASYLYNDSLQDYYVKEALDEEISLLNHGLGSHIHWYIDESIPLSYRIEVANLVIDLNSKLHQDGHYGSSWTDVIYTYGHLGHMYFQCGDTENAIRYLKKSAELAKKFDKMDRITTMHSSFFEGKQFDKDTLGSTFIASKRMIELFTERYPLSEEFKSKKDFIDIIEFLKS